MLIGSVQYYFLINKIHIMESSKRKRYSNALLGNILFSFGLCVFGESVIAKMNAGHWVYLGTLSLVLINAGIGLMIKNKWGVF